MKTVTIGGSKVSLGRIALTGAVRAEKNMQKKLEAMQLAVLNGDIAAGKWGIAAEKELQAIKKVRLGLKAFQQVPVSNFAQLQLLFDTSLKTLTLESLATEYAIQAAAFKAKFLGELSGEQNLVIDRYYGLKARKDWQIISQVSAILNLNKGIVTSAEPTVEQSDKLEKELTLQEQTVE